MSHEHHRGLFTTEQMHDLLSSVQKYIDGERKASAYDNEYDLTAHQEIPELRDRITSLVSNFYGAPVTCYNYWISKSEFGESVVPHHHVDTGSNAVISSVLYLQADNAGMLWFNDLEFGVIPCTGDLVIFPAHYVHSVEPNPSKTARICIAFDFRPQDK